jgi:hypothetical protein
MTLVLQTAAGVNPESDDAIRQTLLRYGLNSRKTSEPIGPATFHYYAAKKEQDANAAIHALMQLPGVVAAYLKPEGIPPM